MATRGRGRGRGRGGPQPRGAEAMEAEIEYKAQPLFPEFPGELNPPSADNDTLRLDALESTMRILNRLPYRLDAPKIRTGHERFSDKYRRAQSVNGSLTEMPFDPHYLTPELRAVWDTQYKKSLINTTQSGRAVLDIAKILAEAESGEDKGRSRKNIHVADDIDDGDFGAFVEDDFDEELEGEYILNFYDDDFDPFEEDNGEDGTY